MLGRRKAKGDCLNLGTKEELEVTGYRDDRLKLGLTVVATVLSGGLLLLLLTWRPSIRLAFTHRRCSIKDANRLLIKDIYNQLWEEKVVRDGEHLYFINRKLKYVWDDATCTFARLRPTDHAPTFSTFHNGAEGLTGKEAARRQELFGENFMKIDVLSVWQLLIQQAINPFYIFQVFTVILWCIQDYYVYSSCIVALSVTSIFIMVWETRRQSIALRETVTSQSEMMVIRDGKRVVLSSRDVVPGDVVFVDSVTTRLEVDAVLLYGSIITNEAMLTGESLPVTKVAVPLGNDTLFCEEEHKHHLLYSGTQVLQVRGAIEVPAIVIKTGFYTARGELVRSILFPKPTDFHFYKDLMKMLSIFLLLGFAAMGWSFYKKSSQGDTFWVTLVYSLDLVTFVVPPLLPATLTAINVWAQQRLKKKKVYCLSSNYISQAGSVDLVCFDKTGTLTEEDLDLAGLMQCSGGDFKPPQEDMTHLPPGEPLTKALATCHSLALIDGKLKGSPLDMKIFTGIAWALQEPMEAENTDYGMEAQLLVWPQTASDADRNQYEVAIIRIFPFESSEQRMTVVAKAKMNTSIEVFIKGAPERVAALCSSNTVPGLLEAAVGWYTHQGLRVLAVAGKALEGYTWNQAKLQPREELEKNATFLGLVLLQNKLKIETPPVLATLHRAHLTPVMVTGDNLLTALSVAQQSGLVLPGQQIIIVKAVMEASSSKAAQHLKVFYYDADHTKGVKNQKLMPVRSDNYVLATDGESFDLLASAQDKSTFYRVLHKGRVFARMKPDQKITVVETLQHLGHHVAMCGDGCNDCGALKAADAGISLSSAEASVAAPFTSRQENINCVPVLIKEGRAVLVSIFSTFKYNVVATFGALLCVIWNYEVNTEPSDVQYVIMDLMLMTVPPLVMGCTHAAPNLNTKRPHHRILNFVTIVSIFSYIAFQFTVYWGMLTYLSMQSWFVPLDPHEDIWPPEKSYENTILTLVCFYFLVIGVFVFSHAAPHLKPIYTNYALTVHLIFASAFCLFLNFYTGQWYLDFVNLKRIPDTGFVGIMFFSMCTILAICFVWERWFLYGVLDKYVMPFFLRCCGKKHLYVKIEEELKNNSEWPVLTEAPDYEDKLMFAAEEKLMDGMTFGGEEFDDDDVEKAMFVRKLTRRHRFNATVTHISENKRNSHSSSEAATATITDASLSNDRPQDQHKPLISQNSGGYREPWDSVPFSEESEQRKGFNQSVRHQIMKGTGGGFKTFKSSIKRQAGFDESAAQPYEVVPLSGYNDSTQEAIYSTISEIPMSDYKQPYEATDNPKEERQESEEAKNETFRESAAAETWCKDLLYDIPKPPRPVEQPYSPAGESTSHSFPLPPPVMLSEEDPHQTSQEYNC
ncbi:polyamine-transporting ATPase 13A3-like isoform X2 [Portunus trituberculatus]|uniref:polyamine-transporting ATPase 13A3-like isoform X2 n=1 Tax=Portunus trituberculatus TaxID=210409 RepID=UPI001E1CB052|nr:polyamine-transporting ATPase 13A3-like isoform X2 [Portunus trituberculatus]